MANKLTNIKGRVLEISKYHKISYEKFFEEIGMTYGNFKGKAKNTPLNSDAIENILTKYTDVNASWLLTGRGEMIVNNKPAQEQNKPTIIYRDNPEKDEIIQLQREQIALLKEKLAQKDDVVHFTNVPSSPQQVGVAASVRDKRCKTNDH